VPRSSFEHDWVYRQPWTICQWKPDSPGRDPALTDEWRCKWGRWSRSGSCKGRQHRAIVVYDCAGL